MESGRELHGVGLEHREARAVRHDDAVGAPRARALGVASARAAIEGPAAPRRRRGRVGAVDATRGTLRRAAEPRAPSGVLEAAPRGRAPEVARGRRWRSGPRVLSSARGPVASSSPVYVPPPSAVPGGVWVTLFWASKGEPPLPRQREPAVLLAWASLTHHSPGSLGSRRPGRPAAKTRTHRARIEARKRQGCPRTRRKRHRLAKASLIEVPSARSYSFAHSEVLHREIELPTAMADLPPHQTPRPSRR